MNRWDSEPTGVSSASERRKNDILRPPTQLCARAHNWEKVAELRAFVERAPVNASVSSLLKDSIASWRQAVLLRPLGKNLF